jgi:Leucine-rich repeat (LRR) protein
LSYSDALPEWKLLDKIGRVLVMGQGKQDSIYDRMRYKEYTHLEMLNVKKIEASFLKLGDLPLWIRKNHNLKILIISNNILKDIKKEILPPNLVEISAENNLMTAIDLSQQTHLARLDLNNNKLAQINLKNLTELT